MMRESLKKETLYLSPGVAAPPKKILVSPWTEQTYSCSFPVAKGTFGGKKTPYVE